MAVTSISRSRFASRLCVLLLLPAIAMVFVGCLRNDLEEEAGNLTLNVNVDMNLRFLDESNKKKPETIIANFYSPETFKRVSVGFVKGSSGKVDIEAGNYHMALYNFDTEVTRLRNEDDLRKIEAYTDTVSLDVRKTYHETIRSLQQAEAMRLAAKQRRVASDTSIIRRVLRSRSWDLNVPIIYEPDHLFVSVKKDAHVPIRTVGKDTSIYIGAEAKSIVQTYKLEIAGIKGLQYAARAEAFLTGQIKSRFVGTDSISQERATLYLPLKVEPKNGLLSVTFNSFGQYPGEKSEIYLNVMLTSVGGERITCQFDVSKAIEEQEKNPDKELPIRFEEPIEVPKPQEGSGFKPSLEKWDDEIFNIPI